MDIYTDGTKGRFVLELEPDNLNENYECDGNMKHLQISGGL